MTFHPLISFESAPERHSRLQIMQLSQTEPGSSSGDGVSSASVTTVTKRTRAPNSGVIASPL